MDNQHTPSAGQNQPDSVAASRMLKICHNPYCGFKTLEAISKCPKCGRPVWTTSQFRVLSSFLIFLGGILLAAGVGLIILVASKVSGTNRDGGESLLIFLYLLFGLIAAFGLSVMATGVWQVLFGSANLKLIGILLSLLVGLLLIVGFGRLIMVVIEN